MQRRGQPLTLSDGADFALEGRGQNVTECHDPWPATLPAMVLALVLAASGVTLFSGPELIHQPTHALKQHLVELDDELFVLKQSLSATSGDVFLKSTGDAAPFVALAGVPSLLLGLLLRESSTYRGSPVIETGVIVAGVLLGSAVVAALVYAVARMISHGFDVAQWTARERKLSEYRPQIVSALNPT